MSRIVDLPDFNPASRNTCNITLASGILERKQKTAQQKYN